MLLSTNEIKQMRKDIENMTLPSTCTILSVTRASDGMGGMTDTWGTAYEDVACRLDNYTGQEMLIAGEVQAFSKFMLTVPFATTLTIANRVLVGSTTYNVTSVTSGDWQVCKRATLEEV